MCHTNYIHNLFAGTSEYIDILPISMKRSDGEIFTVNLRLEHEHDINKVRTLFNYLEELRTCSCTKFEVCEKHSNIRKI